MRIRGRTTYSRLFALCFGAIAFAEQSPGEDCLDFARTCCLYGRRKEEMSVSSLIALPVYTLHTWVRVG